MNMTILALDLGTTTGWALMRANGQIASGSQSFKPQRFEGGGMRFLKFKRWLTDVKQCTSGIDLVVFEEVRRHAGVDAAHAYGGFIGKLTAWCEHHQIPYEGVPVGTIRAQPQRKRWQGEHDRERTSASATTLQTTTKRTAICVVYLTTHARQTPEEV